MPAKIKFTKGELKKQRDSLKQYQRYLPTLQLKKQQLQMEILSWLNLLDEKKHTMISKIKSADNWIRILSDDDVDFKKLVIIDEVFTIRKNIAGLDIDMFSSIKFKDIEYDLFLTPLWVDQAIEFFKNIVSLQKEIQLIQDGLFLLRRELRITTQRVNLFEKVMIPSADNAIRLIKIYLGDQMANAVGRSKIAKNKIELEEALLNGAGV